jgi:hypothetical protein
MQKNPLNLLKTMNIVEDLIHKDEAYAFMGGCSTGYEFQRHFNVFRGQASC